MIIIKSIITLVKTQEKIPEKAPQPTPKKESIPKKQVEPQALPDIKIEIVEP